MTIRTIASLLLVAAISPVTSVQADEEATGGTLTETQASPANPCDCGGLCESCCPVACCCEGWFAEAGVLFLSRSRSDSVTLVDDQNSGAELLNARDFDFDYQVAPRVRLIHDRACCIGWELGYFGLDSWNEEADTGGTVSPRIFLPGGFPILSTAPGTMFRTSYGTDLHSAELNRRCAWSDCVTLLAGFRWVELSDELSFQQTVPVQRSLFSVDTDNHLYGFQLGADAGLWSRGNLYVDTIVRAGVYYNHADQTTFAPILTGAPGVVDSVSADDDNASFLGEIGFRGAYYLNDRWAVQAGYHLVWIEGVALAPDQLAATSLAAPGAAVLDNGAGLFLDGASIGLLLSY